MFHTEMVRQRLIEYRNRLIALSLLPLSSERAESAALESLVFEAAAYIKHAFEACPCLLDMVPRVQLVRYRLPEVDNLLEGRASDDYIDACVGDAGRKILQSGAKFLVNNIAHNSFLGTVVDPADKLVAILVTSRDYAGELFEVSLLEFAELLQCIAVRLPEEPDRPLPSVQLN